MNGMKLSTLWQVLLRTVRLAMVRLTIAFSAKRLINGVEVVNQTDQNRSEEYFEDVQAALAVLEQYAPWYLKTVQRNLERILIVYQPGSTYWAFVKSCALSRVTLESQPPPWVASIILHEAVHGRLHRRGIRYEGQLRSRIEHICLKHQLLLLARVPDSEHLVEHLLRHASGDWFSEDELRRANARKLNALGAPRWVTRWLSKEER